MTNEIILNSKYKPLYQKHPKTRYYIVTGGRASGKSFAVTDAAAQYLTLPNQVILFTRYTMVSAKKSIIPEFEEKINMRGGKYPDQFDIEATQIKNPSANSICYFSGIRTSQGTQTARMKGIKNLNCWIFDEAEEMTDFEEFSRIDETIRVKGVDNRIIIIMNPSHKKHWVYSEFISKAHERTDTTFITTSYKDNLHNLSDSYIENIERTRKLNPKRYAHIFGGEWLDDIGGLLWNKEILDLNRVYEKPNFKEIIVAIDPAVTAKPDSDETGIVVAGLDYEGTGYLLDDLSGRYSPEQWAKTAKLAANKWGARRYVAEKNQGGDMVKHTIRQYDKERKIKLVTATKGKIVRAEPIYSLCEQGKIKHLGNFEKLENQLKFYSPENKDESPDRMDAYVWAFTDLMINNKKRVHVITT